MMPCGLGHAPTQFTLLMICVLQDLDAVIVFMDNILVYSKSIQDHHTHSRLVFQRMREKKLYAAPKKREFCRTGVE
jgi:hypothetical protein